MASANTQISTYSWLGLWTLYLRESRRFINVGMQTILAPVITTLIFLTVFAVALGRSERIVAGVPYLEFLAPGLIVMAILQNSFANTSSSLMTAKMQGSIVDTLMPPLTSLQLTIGYSFSGATRGLIVACMVTTAMSVFVDFTLHSLPFVLFHAINAALMLSMLGMISGIWADKHEYNSAVTNFVIMPLSFLSGSFYSIERLPESFQTFAHLNPFFYLIDGFRYGFIGRSDSSLEMGIAAITGINIVLAIVCYRMFDTGYKLKP
ncbi:MAG: ABC transporter permease [Rhodospirillaceae bacterium]|jgi:ABC-2 type transport system permease protein|nr:ABC transporter permease [Rhodospirillales bacterium]MBT3906513.1 ABC transporter permease [Rhodospirillaceae bacterium]MBT4701525.1 ABC transporter permease [Rhodospirillaceae bacterium]MBT5034074.1 ABC transporter permease [Rhodospirillaceae bacterium]MBT6218860.1 ABC transporter permease [Rhodospirillaceae bacterium]